MKKKQMILLSALIVLISLLTASKTFADERVYRLYNPQNGEHLYTTDANERNVLYFDYGWGFEGEGWVSPENGTPVYRLYNPILQHHLYTTNTKEVNLLTATYGWLQDNHGKPVFYSGGSLPIFRVYNPSLRGLHHWTTDANEYNILPRYGWKQEGTTFNALQKGQQIKTHFIGNNQPEKLGNTDYIFLMEDEAELWADYVINDPSSEYASYNNYEVKTHVFPNGAVLYYVVFS